MDIQYYQGETISFQMQGDSTINLDTNDFVCLFYSYAGSPIIINKVDFVFISPNVYSASIPNTTTKNMQLGRWTQEILYGTSQTSILKEDCFSILPSQSKNLI